MTGEWGPVFLVVVGGHRSRGVIWAWPWTQGAQDQSRESEAVAFGGEFCLEKYGCRLVFLWTLQDKSVERREGCLHSPGGRISTLLFIHPAWPGSLRAGCCLPLAWEGTWRGHMLWYRPPPACPAGVPLFPQAGWTVIGDGDGGLAWLSFFF